MHSPGVQELQSTREVLASERARSFQLQVSLVVLLPDNFQWNCLLFCKAFHNSGLLIKNVRQFTINVRQFYALDYETVVFHLKT